MISRQLKSRILHVCSPHRRNLLSDGRWSVSRVKWCSLKDTCGTSSYPSRQQAPRVLSWYNDFLTTLMTGKNHAPKTANCDFVFLSVTRDYDINRVLQGQIKISSNILRTFSKSAIDSDNLVTNTTVVPSRCCLFKIQLCYTHVDQ